jgi:hypothetical protein
VIAAGAALLAAGCAASKEDVKLMGEEQAKEFAGKFCDDPEYLGCRTNEEKNEITYGFNDKELGFEFAAITRPNERGMDGTTFFYEEGAYCSWQEMYYKMVDESCENSIEDMCREKNIEVSWQINREQFIIDLVLPLGVEPESESELYGKNYVIANASVDEEAHIAEISE